MMRLLRPSGAARHLLRRPPFFRPDPSFSTAAPLSSFASDFRLHSTVLSALFLATATSAAALLLPGPDGGAVRCDSPPGDSASEADDATTTLLNWSGTHSCRVADSLVFEPTTPQEVAAVLAAVPPGATARPIGSALSPNALSFSADGVIKTGGLDRILRVDPEARTVTAEAGLRVSDLLDALRPHGLTLENLASIQEQAIAGLVGVGAHGSGARIPPIDAGVLSLTMETPSQGTVVLGANDPLLPLAAVGLGMFGVTTELTLRCVPAHRLVERTYLYTRARAAAECDALLGRHRHVRYMWIPYADAVVVVVSDPEGSAEAAGHAPTEDDARRAAWKFRPLTDLLETLRYERAAGAPADDGATPGFGELRDRLLSYGPLDPDLVRRVNAAEAEFWRRCDGSVRVAPSDRVLQFDCGGEQWVLEHCFATGTGGRTDGTDVRYVTELLRAIESSGLPAPAPIEQRWSCGSPSLLSPAHGGPTDLFTWVGIIMYLPPDGPPEVRKHITDAFREQYAALHTRLGRGVGAATHWAKLEVPEDPAEREALRQELAKKFPVDAVNYMRYLFDRNGVLSNRWVNELFGKAALPEGGEDEVGGAKGDASL